MRILESLKIPYTHHTYECEEFVDGLQIADKLSLPYEQVYKTLVTVSNSKNYFVFVIPIAAELDLKKAAKSVGEKSVEMIHVKDINAITGYIRGGCTAIGMKKQYVTRIDESAKTQEQIYVSGGKIGSQIRLTPEDLAKAAKAEFADIIRHENQPGRYRKDLTITKTYIKEYLWKKKKQFSITTPWHWMKHRMR